jgi:hypothetical protein
MGGKLPLTPSRNSTIGCNQSERNRTVTYEEKIDHLIELFKELFNCRHWEIYRRVLAVEFMPEGADGYCNIDYKYMTANIDIQAGLDDKRLLRVVAHEMAHVLLAPISMAGNYAIECVSENKKAHIEQLLNVAQEQVCELLSRGLMLVDEVADALKEAKEDGI